VDDLARGSPFLLLGILGVLTRMMRLPRGAWLSNEVVSRPKQDHTPSGVEHRAASEVWLEDLFEDPSGTDDAERHGGSGGR
jgi:hypothetical protein